MDEKGAFFGKKDFLQKCRSKNINAEEVQTTVLPFCFINNFLTLQSFTEMFFQVYAAKQCRQNNYDLIAPFQVRRELVGQIEKFKEITRGSPLYIDGHQHVNVFPSKEQGVVCCTELVLLMLMHT